MFAEWIRLGVVGVVLATVGGCWTANKALKPPKPEPEFILPPADDPTVSSPPSYPKRVMNGDRVKTEQRQADTLATPGMTAGPQH